MESSRASRLRSGTLLDRPLVTVSQGLLRESEPGTYLVRVSESRFGYSLSHVFVGTHCGAWR